MVIQRLQTVYLFLASILMGFFCYLPLASYGDVDFCPYQQPVYLTLNVLISVLSLVAIFLYKNLSRQQTAVKVNAFLIVASAIVVEIIWTAGPLLLICSFLMTIAALRRIKHDDKLLKAADRIR